MPSSASPADPAPATPLAVHWSGRTDPAAPTLVLMHGITDSGTCWPDAVRRWESSYRIAGVDALGHGSSPRFTPEQLAGDPMQAMYDAAAAALARITSGGRNRAVVVGHSMGGGISAALAAHAPDLVRGAVLEDPAWLLHVVDEEVRAAADERAAEPARVATDVAAEIAKGRLEHPTWPESELAPWAQAKVECDEAFLRAAVAWLREPWQHIVERIAVPTLVVTGTDQVILGPETIRAVSLANPAVPVEVVPGTGHCVRRDDPDGYHALVDPWLEQVFRTS